VREYGGGTGLGSRLLAPEDGGDPASALPKGGLKFILAGEKLRVVGVIARF
jgi:hypothetical protein